MSIIYNIYLKNTCKNEKFQQNQRLSRKTLWNFSNDLWELLSSYPRIALRSFAITIRSKFEFTNIPLFYWIEDLLRDYILTYVQHVHIQQRRYRPQSSPLSSHTIIITYHIIYQSIKHSAISIQPNQTCLTVCNTIYKVGFQVKCSNKFIEKT